MTMEPTSTACKPPASRLIAEPRAYLVAAGTCGGQAETTVPSAANNWREREKLLSLDLLESDYLYRIKKDNRVVYVSVEYTDFIPRKDRTDGDRVVPLLRSLPAWDEPWDTLTVVKASDGVSSLLDAFKPHGLSHLPPSLAYAQHYNFLDLPVVSRISSRVSLVRCGDVQCIRKIARFEYELRYLHREIMAYSVLEDFSLKPKFMGYVFENPGHRVIGFLMEALDGRHPQESDLGICQAGVLRLHAHNVAHNDLNKYNILIQGDNPMFFDFEVASFPDDPGFAKSQVDEMEGLADKLADMSGVGKKP